LERQKVTYKKSRPRQFFEKKKAAINVLDGRWKFPVVLRCHNDEAGVLEDVFVGRSYRGRRFTLFRSIPSKSKANSSARISQRCVLP
jgi:hypothetical protein